MDQYPPFAADDEDELDVEDAFGEHDVEYWVRAGNRLVPAVPEQVATIREHEALRRLARWQRLEAEQARHAEQVSCAARVRWLTAAIRRAFAPISQGAQVEMPDAPAERIDTGATSRDAGRTL